jgi:hypothetical protein
MAGQRIFQAFFSYAHHDADTDPTLAAALTVELEKRVTARLVNARFAIWRDTKGLRTGARWDATIERAVHESDILIVLLGPRWLDSQYCRKEYAIFRQVERARNRDGIVPIGVRRVDIDGTLPTNRGRSMPISTRGRFITRCWSRIFSR